MKHWTFAAVLPVPPGINRTYASGIAKSGKSVFYKKAAAKQWAETAYVELRRQGWRELPHGRYTWHLRYNLRCPWRRDIDSVQKALIDAAALALNLNDRDLTDGGWHKDKAPKRSEHIQVTVNVYEVES